MTVSSIIVTYNRSQELMRCLNAVVNQTKKLNSIVIVNNASTDNTLEQIYKFTELSANTIANEYEKLTLLKSLNGTDIYLFNKKENTGGSGGFYSGLKTAHENLKTDYYWLMDDDGYPSENCLETLFTKAEKYDYIMPTSIDIEKHDCLSWPTRMKNGKKTIIYSELKDSWKEIMDFVTPFNGVLLSNNCVDKVGYINKDFFIWGDDYEHYYRCKKNGIQPVTLIPAVFYHPAQKVMLKKICFGLFSLAYSDSPLRMVCLARNWTNIYLHYNQKYKIPLKWVMYWWLFIITRHGDFKGWKLYKQSVKDGFKGDFTRHLQYLKK